METLTPTAHPVAFQMDEHCWPSLSVKRVKSHRDQPNPQLAATFLTPWKRLRRLCLSTLSLLSLASCWLAKLCLMGCRSCQHCPCRSPAAGPRSGLGKPGAERAKGSIDPSWPGSKAPGPQAAPHPSTEPPPNLSAAALLLGLKTESARDWMRHKVSLFDTAPGPKGQECCSKQEAHS